MVSMSYIFSFPGYCPKRPFWLPTGLNLGILGSERGKNTKTILWKRNGCNYGGRVWFQGRISFRFQDIGQKEHQNTSMEV